MEIVIIVLLLLIIAALLFGWMKFRPGAPGGARGVPGRHGGVRGRRRTGVAARHDPMAEAVERHSRATDPHEAAEAELRLRAQANRVASDLHAREAAALDAEVGGTGGRDHAAPLRGHERPAPPDDRPQYEDEDGRPVYEDGRPVYRDEPPRY